LSSHQKKTLTSLVGFENKSFSLLWRGSRDRFEDSSFHQLCDGKENTLTLVKSMTNHVFGGFTSIPWESPTKEFERTYADKSAFLFSINNKIIKILI